MPARGVKPIGQSQQPCMSGNFYSLLFATLWLSLHGPAIHRGRVIPGIAHVLLQHIDSAHEDAAHPASRQTSRVRPLHGQGRHTPWQSVIEDVPSSTTRKNKVDATLPTMVPRGASSTDLPCAPCQPCCNAAVKVPYAHLVLARLLASSGRLDHEFNSGDAFGVGLRARQEPVLNYLVLRQYATACGDTAALVSSHPGLGSLPRPDRISTALCLE
nr:hypothetical protein CFP56_64860 [Quercus suber]